MFNTFRKKGFTQPHFYPRKSGAGFTLIELLVVIAIFGLLASVVWVSLQSSKERARITAILQFSATIYHSLGANAVGVWDFNEGAGTAARDSSGNENNGTIDGVNWEWTSNTPSGQGYALNFKNGSPAYVDLGAKPSLNPRKESWTVEGWVFARSSGPPTFARFPIGDNQPPPPGPPVWGIDVPGNSLGISILFSDGTNYQNSTINCDPGYKPGDTTNKWTHIVVIFDRTIGKAYAYVNGVKQSGEVNISSVTGDVTNSSNHISNIKNWFFLDGVIDGVRIYNTALTSAQVQQHYAEGSKKRGLAAND